MNQRKEKTTITIENYRRTVIHLKRNVGNTTVCELCGIETTMIRPHEAAKILKITPREIFRLVESGKVHFLEAETSELFICRESCQNLLR
jgi:formate dehydrogenase assembly factor FdhD